MDSALNDQSLDQIFRSARTPNGWADRPAEDDMVHEIYDLMRGDRALSTVGAETVTQKTTSPTLVVEGSKEVETRMLAVDGGQIAYDDTGGHGPLIIALPGMGDLRSEYRFLRPELVKTGYRVVTVDIRGFGQSSANWKDVSARAVGRDAIALIDHLEATSAVILGNSFAAGAALWAAQDAPGKVSAVVLLGPIVRDPPKSPWYVKALLTVGFSGPWRVWFWATYWDSLFPTRKPEDHAQAKAVLTKNLREPGRMSTLRAMINTSKSDTAIILPTSRVPALVVMGTRDADFPDATAEARWLADQLHAECLIVDGAGHYPHTEMPEQVLPKLLSFISHVPS